MIKKHCNIPIFIPELACPHQCVFCNQEKISNTFSIPKPHEIHTTIEEHLGTISNDKEINIAFFGGSFTGIPREQMLAYLEATKYYIASGQVQGIRISTRPDYISEELLDLLQPYHVTAIELGAQSTNDKVLTKSGRGHNYEAIKKAAQSIKKRNIELGLQMMIGLPHDTIELSMQTARDIIQLQADSTRIYPTLVIKDTALEKLYHAGKYQVLSLEQAINWSKEILKIFNETNIKILRLGLHPSEELTLGKSLVAGPFHPSFKEMVLSALWKDLLEAKLEKTGKYTVHVAQNQLNYAIGYQRINRLAFQKKNYDIQFKVDQSISNFDFYVRHH